MKIYTKRGDQGQTDLFGGQRVSKAHKRVVAYGAVDAANSMIGYAFAIDNLPAEMSKELLKIMSDLFDLGADIATVPSVAAKRKLDKMLISRVTKERISQLELLIDEAQAGLAPLKNFILPTGTELSCRFHMARTAIRLAEQKVVVLMQEGEAIRPDVLSYLNRLSDLFFVWSRVANQHSSKKEYEWVASKSKNKA